MLGTLWSDFSTPLLRLILRQDIGIHKKLECARFYFTAYGCRALFATLPRSGYNYAILMINTAWDMAQGGAGEYRYEGGKWKTKYRLQTPMDWRTPLQAAGNLAGPIIFHTHLSYRLVPSFQRRKMKVAVLVRNIFDQLKSEFIHEDYNASSQYEYLDRDGAVDRTIDFYNSWGAFLEDHEASYLLRYEELIRRPDEVLKGLSDFWGLDLPDGCLRAAVERCGREEMIKRIPREEWPRNPRITIMNGRGEFSEASIQFIKTRIGRRLRYPLGYDYGNVRA